MASALKKSRALLKAAACSTDAMVAFQRYWDAERKYRTETPALTSGVQNLVAYLKTQLSLNAAEAEVIRLKAMQVKTPQL